MDRVWTRSFGCLGAFQGEGVAVTGQRSFFHGETEFLSQGKGFFITRNGGFYHKPREFDEARDFFDAPARACVLVELKRSTALKLDGNRLNIRLKFS